jgi:hypothetical protein
MARRTFDVVDIIEIWPRTQYSTFSQLCSCQL